MPGQAHDCPKRSTPCLQTLLATTAADNDPNTGAKDARRIAHWCSPESLPPATPSHRSVPMLAREDRRRARDIDPGDGLESHESTRSIPEIRQPKFSADVRRRCSKCSGRCFHDTCRRFWTHAADFMSVPAADGNIRTFRFHVITN